MVNKSLLSILTLLAVVLLVAACAGLQSSYDTVSQASYGGRTRNCAEELSRMPRTRRSVALRTLCAHRGLRQEPSS